MSLKAGLLALSALAVAGVAQAKQPADLAGIWLLSFDATNASCRVVLQPDRSDAGDYFLGMPAACRHAMPGIAAVGRWAMPDDGHLTLDAPGGKPVLILAAGPDGYSVTSPAGTYGLKAIASGRSAVVGSAPVGLPSGPPTASSEAPALQRIASRQSRGEATETSEDLAGRYAVLRDKRDTGCMVTLDRSHAKGGDRAQLAPGCRDQGIVIFDPSTWQIIHGNLVLTARAGHKTKLEKQDDGVWMKDPKEGGKPLALKKL